jgi:hypothetical protein
VDEESRPAPAAEGATAPEPPPSKRGAPAAAEAGA